jgi:hypothetical protein
MRRWFSTNQGVGMLLTLVLLILLAYLWQQPWVHRVMRDGFTLGFFPLLGAVSMLVFTSLLIIDPLRREVPEDMEEGRWTDIPTALGLLAGVYGYFQLTLSLGFLLATPIFLSILMLLFGVRPLRLVLVVSIVVPIVIYVLFGLLGIRMPQGILPFGF